MPAVEPNSPAPTPRPARLRAVLSGVVQGVGFRPFIYRLASEQRLKGWVNNSPAGVVLEVEGDRAALELFLRRIQQERPALSSVDVMALTWLEPAGYGRFEIRESEGTGSKSALVPPDIATCADCAREIFDPGNRRFHYPFTNCTQCGPRFTIVEAVPYDRANTSMKAFVMCPECQGEYDDPGNRRFHAQPNACPKCGPQLELWNGAGHALAGGPEALERAVERLRGGEILAVKGLGGFHLMAAAHREETVRELRKRKGREEKPLALMFPSLAEAQRVCEVSDLEEELLVSPSAPIVLLRRRSDIPDADLKISPTVAPGNPCLGVMLPYTPLHHLLLAQLGFPVVATSGNAAEEPICIDAHEAVERLRGLADAFLVHNRPIVRHADDSIVRLVAERELVLRRARGYAPLPIVLPDTGEPGPILAVGAHLKNTIGLAIGREAFLSQHIGDLETEQALDAFHRVIIDFENFYQAKPTLIVADAHPDYLSTRYALSQGTEVLQVQHHYAHVLACMAEHGLAEDVLGVSWDGTGYGLDDTVWGGEFLTIIPDSFERFAHFRTFCLPGGEQAVKEPRRAALGLLYELYGEAAFERHDLAPVQAFSAMEIRVIRQMLDRKLNSPRTSSVGRLFDAVASLAGVRQRASFEGQAAMELEFAVAGSGSAKVTSAPESGIALVGGNRGPAEPLVLDWSPLVEELIQRSRNGASARVLARWFHDALAQAVVQVAQLASRTQVVLSGGCFQNKYLTERTVQGLRVAGFTPYWHKSVPPNDGGIALGQIMAARRLRKL